MTDTPDALPIQPLSLDALSDIRCTPARARVDGTDVLVLAYRGHYRDGSLGSPDAARMRADALAALAVWSDDALVYDFRELHYRWGNNLVDVFTAEPPDALEPIASAIVVGPDSRVGLGSLCRPECLFESLDDAIRVVARQAREAAAERDRVEDLLTLPILLRHGLTPAQAVRAAARAATTAHEYFNNSWQMRLWVLGNYRLVVLAASPDDLAWATRQLHAISVRDPDQNSTEVGVVVTPLSELPERLASLPPYA